MAKGYLEEHKNLNKYIFSFQTKHIYDVGYRNRKVEIFEMYPARCDYEIKTEKITNDENETKIIETYIFDDELQYIRFRVNECYYSKTCSADNNYIYEYKRKDVQLEDLIPQHVDCIEVGDEKAFAIFEKEIKETKLLPEFLIRNSGAEQAFYNLLALKKINRAWKNLKTKIFYYHFKIEAVKWNNNYSDFGIVFDFEYKRNHKYLNESFKYFKNIIKSEKTQTKIKTNFKTFKRFNINNKINYLMMISGKISDEVHYLDSISNAIQKLEENEETRKD